MSPNLFVPIALTAFALAAFGCMSAMPARRAVVVLLVGGWLFLPHFDDHYRFLFFISKASVVSTVVLAASLLLDGGSWRGLRPRAFDLVVAVLCVESYFTATSNGFDAREGVRATLDTFMSWGAPYLLGRVYFGSLRHALDLVVGLVGGALVYVAPTLWEVRMSPTLHETFYGFRPFGFDQTIRFGGWRPNVFMQHGLAIGLFMALGALGAYWLWRTRGVREVLGVPIGWATIALLATTVLCKSTGAILLLLVGIGLLEATRRFPAGWLVVALALAPAVYCTARIEGWGPDTAVTLARTYLNEERAGSLQFRLDNEKVLLKKAMVRPWLGWGRFGRSFVYDEEGTLLTITDSLWIIYLGVSGLVGLAAIGLLLAWPVLALLRKLPARTWGHPAVGPAATLAVILLLWAVDDLLNAMFTPIYPVAAGALITLVAAPLGARRRVTARAGTAGPPGAAPELR
jgi:hypothetical protein